MKYFFRLWASLSILTVTILVAGSLFPAEARAEDTIKLEIDVTASTPWEISGVVPGDSGNKTIELRNTGTLDGMVYIWISHIVNSEGVNPESEEGNLAEPGELGKYIILQLTCDGLDTNFGQPAVIGTFPEKRPPLSTRFMKIPLAAGETISPHWQWWFYDNGMPQNDAQGDTVSFDINYYLTEPLPVDCVEIKKGGGAGGGAPADWPIIIDVLGVNTGAKLSLIDKLIEAVVATGPEGKNKLEFEQGTEISSGSDRHIVKLVLRVYPDPPEPPEGTLIVGDAYEIVGYISDALLSPVTFDPPGKLTLDYELLLPEGSGPPFLAFYEDTETWQVIEGCTVGDDTLSVTGPIDRTATFAILVEVKPEEPPPETSTTVTTSTIITTPVTTASAVTTTPVTTPGITTPVVTTSGPPVPSTTVTSPVDLRPTVSTTIKQAGMEQDSREKKAFWRTFSLSVAIAGVTAMTALGVVERLRRSGRSGAAGKDSKDDE